MRYELPNLPYAYNALEPYLDEETMHFHYDKHYQGYLNKLLEVMEKYHDLKEQKNPIELLKGLDDLLVSEEDRIKIKNFGGGFVNHTLFWEVMNPINDKNEELIKDIERDFGTINEMKGQFSELAKKHFGSGWVWLVKNSGGKLEVYSLPNQDSPFSLGHQPILTLDVWEHAYYLKYKNKRDEFINAWWSVIKVV